MCSYKPKTKTKWLYEIEFAKANCVKCIIKYGDVYLKNGVPVQRQMDECRKKMLIECDPPEFDDCIRLDRKCYDVARELEKEDEQNPNAKNLSLAKKHLLAERKREHIRIKMFGPRYWEKK